jgi:hypothetical protein
MRPTLPAFSAAILRTAITLALFAFAVPIAEGSVTYTYTGNPFTVIDGTQANMNSASYISVTLVFTSALPAGLFYVDVTSNLQSWSITNGHDGFDNRSASRGRSVTFSVVLSTDALGNIVGPWNIRANSVVHANPTQAIMQFSGTSNCASQCPSIPLDKFDYVESCPCALRSYGGSGAPNPNGWMPVSEAPAPEPLAASHLVPLPWRLSPNGPHTPSLEGARSTLQTAANYNKSNLSQRSSQQISAAAIEESTKVAQREARIAITSKPRSRLLAKGRSPGWKYATGYAG